MAESGLAFVVYGDEYSVVVFADKNVVARRVGAAELNEEFSSVSCRRAPEFDSFAPMNGVPREVLWDKNWWYECSKCFKLTSKDEGGNMSSGDATCEDCLGGRDG